MVIEIASIFMILTVFVSSIIGEDFCYVTDKNPYLYFGLKTSYNLVRAPEMKIVEPSRKLLFRSVYNYSQVLE